MAAEIHFPVEDIFSRIEQAQKKCKSTLQFGTLKVNITKTLKTFYNKGVKCDVCGAEGHTFELRQDSNNPTLYLTLLTKNKIPFTIDHTVPRCVGGEDASYNRVPLCRTCNSEWKSPIDQQLKRNLLGLTKDRKNFLIIAEGDAHEERKCSNIQSNNISGDTLLLRDLLV